MDRPRAAAGSIPASSRPKTAIARGRARRTARTGTGGDTRGRPIVASFITARPQDRMASRGASARSWSGGTRPPANGRGSTRRMPLARRRRRRPPVSPTPAPGCGARAGRSSCTPTDWAGCGCRADSRMDRCPRTTSRSNRPSRIQSTLSKPSPVADRRARPDNAWADSPDERFPHVMTTYRLTEHHTAGGMSRTLSHLAELQPALVL